MPEALDVVVDRLLNKLAQKTIEVAVAQEKQRKLQEVVDNLTCRIKELTNDQATDSPESPAS